MPGCNNMSGKHKYETFGKQIFIFYKMEEEFYNQIIHYVSSPSYSDRISDSPKKKIRRNASGIILKEGLLYKELISSHVLIIKQGEVGRILQECPMILGVTKVYIPPMASLKNYFTNNICTLMFMNPMIYINLQALELLYTNPTLEQTINS